MFWDTYDSYLRQRRICYVARVGLACGVRYGGVFLLHLFAINLDIVVNKISDIKTRMSGAFSKHTITTYPAPSESQ